MATPPARCPFCQAPAHPGCDLRPRHGVGTLPDGTLCPQGLSKAMAHRSQAQAAEEVGLPEFTIPARWADAVLANMRDIKPEIHPLLAWQLQSVERVSMWVSQCGSGQSTHRLNLLIQGSESNTGKSHVAAAIANELLATGISAAFVDVCRFVQRLDGLRRQRFDDDGPSLEYLLDTATRCGVLVLDDLRSDTIPDGVTDQVWNLVNGRYALKKPIILTTNLSLAQIERNDRWHRIISKIMRDCQVVNVDKAAFDVPPPAKSPREQDQDALRQDQRRQFGAQEDSVGS